MLTQLLSNKATFTQLASLFQLKNKLLYEKMLRIGFN